MIDGSTIGHSTDSGLLTLSNGLLKVTGGIEVTGAATLSSIKLGGTDVTASASEINKLSGLTASTTELNILTGVTATKDEINVLDGILSSTDELNNLMGSQAATVVNNKAVIYGTNGEVNASKLQVSGVDITATPAEINKLDGVLASTAQINHLVGVSGPIQTQLDNKLSSSDIANLYAPKEGVNTIITTVGALNAGSITAGFGSIDTGSSTITTTGKVTAGELRS